LDADELIGNELSEQELSSVDVTLEEIKKLHALDKELADA
jgi:hypothetical protein